jgi:hypothetical protein
MKRRQWIVHWGATLPCWVTGLKERKIRHDPVATGSAILRKVFGG